MSKTIKDRAFFARIGAIGGRKTKERLKDDPDYYSRIGTLGGQKIKDERGLEYFAELGSRPKSKKGKKE